MECKRATKEAMGGSRQEVIILTSEKVVLNKPPFSTEFTFARLRMSWSKNYSVFNELYFYFLHRLKFNLKNGETGMKNGSDLHSSTLLSKKQILII